MLMAVVSLFQSVRDDGAVGLGRGAERSDGWTYRWAWSGNWLEAEGPMDNGEGGKENGEGAVSYENGEPEE